MGVHLKFYPKLYELKFEEFEKAEIKKGWKLKKIFYSMLVYEPPLS